MQSPLSAGVEWLPALASLVQAVSPQRRGRQLSCGQGSHHADHLEALELLPYAWMVFLHRFLATEEPPTSFVVGDGECWSVSACFAPDVKAGFPSLRDLIASSTFSPRSFGRRVVDADSAVSAPQPCRTTACLMVTSDPWLTAPTSSYEDFPFVWTVSHESDGTGQLPGVLWCKTAALPPMLRPNGRDDGQVALLQLQGRFTKMLEEVLMSPDRAIQSCCVLSEAESVLLQQWSFGGPPPASSGDSVAAAVTRQWDQYPDESAIWSPNSCYSFGELKRRAVSVAKSITRQPAISVIGICLLDPVATVILQTAAMIAGVSVVHIDSCHPNQRIEYMLQAAAVSAVVVDEDRVAERFGRMEVPLLRWGVLTAVTTGEDLSPAGCGEVLASTICCISFTSGSTGR